MEFQQLEMFAAVIEEGSVSRAAERVCRTPPAVSIALRKLEAEIGAPLFDRSERLNYQPTASGKLLYSYATRILELRKEATTAVKDLTQSRRRILRIGTHESTSLYLLPSLIHSFSEAHPGIKTEVVCGNSERLLVALGNRTVEIALIGDAPDEPHLERHLIKRDELVLITSTKHRLASARQVSVPDLSGEFLIVEGTKSVLRERIVRALRESDTPFNVGVENVAIEAIKRMVIQGLGVGFVPRMCVTEEAARGNLVTIKVEGLRAEWNLSLVFRKDHSLSSVARSFIDVSLANAESFSSDAAVRENRERNLAARSNRTKSFGIASL
jgi:DNA-binding transcriptional LysR family regulator